MSNLNALELKSTSVNKELFKDNKTEFRKNLISDSSDSTIDIVLKDNWNKCLEIISDLTSPQIAKTWFTPIKPLVFSENALTLQVPSQFYYEWIEAHYSDLLLKTIKRVFGHGSSLNFDIIVKRSTDTSSNSSIKLPAFQTPQNHAVAERAGSRSSQGSNLNQRYTFDNFVTGESNQLAFSAAKAVSSNPTGTRYSPLFLYGETGLGKTHIVQAIGNYILKNESNIKVFYTNSERFTLDFINSIQNNKLQDFNTFYRSIDVLLIDDIQFLAGKERTQDNFFHIFNELHQAGKQIIITSDKPPKELQGLDERLKSRFQWGLTVDIQRPDLETRMAIVSKKSAMEGIDLSLEILEYIAANVTSSVRELEGVLISLLAKVTLDGKELTLGLTKEVVQGIANIESRPLNIDFIKQRVSDFYNVPLELMESASRKHEIALSRQMSMYLAKKLTQMSLKTIGAAFGGRDHSTVLHSCTTIDNYLDTDKKVKAAYETLFNELKRGV